MGRAVGPSTVILVDGGGTIVWREQFSQYHAVQDGQLAVQIKRLLAGAPLVRNGPRPVQETEADADPVGDFDSDVPTDDSDGLLF
jgi:hypothetical protein